LLKKTVTSLACAAVLAVPTGNVWAAAHGPKVVPKKKVTVAWYKGIPAPCGPKNKWGDLQIEIQVRKTTTTIGARKKVAIKILNARYPIKSDYTFKTVYITSQALPILTEDLIEFQTANVENISGATDTVVSFKQTLQAALLKAKKPT
jgi:uncharacterized protein with FMN-binding domain